MAGIRARAAWVALTTGVVAALLTVVPPPTASADVDPVITWPTITRFNPDVATYAVQVTGLEPGERVSIGEPWSTRIWIDADGTYPFKITVPPAQTGAHATKAVGGVCVGDDCKLLSYSPDLYVYDHIDTFSRDDAGPSSPVVAVEPRSVPFDADWTVLPRRGDVPIVTGTSSQAQDGVVIGDQSELVTGVQYRLRAHVVIDDALSGHLETTTVSAFTWDASAPELALETRSHNRGWKFATDTVYPTPDKFGDVLWIYVEGGVDHASAVIRNTDGDEVFSRRVDSTTNPAVWRGLDATGAALPEGGYDLTVTGYDAVGNASVATLRLHVDHGVPVVRHWRRTVAASTSAIDRSVGRCAGLHSPARPGWRHSLGFRSRACRPIEATVVSTVHAAFVPRSVSGQYPHARISVVGGKAVGERSAVLTLFSWLTSGKWSSPSRIEGSMGTHRGPLINGRSAVHRGDPGDRPEVIWSVGLGGGMNYDVKRFVVEVDYITVE